MRASTWTALGALVLVMGVAQAADQSKQSLQKEVQPTLKKFETAWTKGDTQAMAAVFAEDAKLINPMGESAEGRAQIQKLFEREHGTGMPMKDSTFSQRITDVRQLAPGVVFADTDITISNMSAPNGRPLPDLQVHGAWVLSNQNGSWQVVEGRPTIYHPRMGMGMGGAGHGGMRMGPPVQPRPMPEPGPEQGVSPKPPPAQ